MVSPVFSVQTLYVKVDAWKSLIEKLRLINAEGIIESANHPFAPPDEIMDGGRGIGWQIVENFLIQVASSESPDPP